MKSQAILLHVVMFDDLPHASAMAEGFSSVSYGDAEYTLCSKATILSEVKEREENASGSEKGELHLLAREIEAIPEGVYIALEG